MKPLRCWNRWSKKKQELQRRNESDRTYQGSEGPYEPSPFSEWTWDHNSSCFRRGSMVRRRGGSFQPGERGGVCTVEGLEPTPDGDVGTRSCRNFGGISAQHAALALPCGRQRDRGAGGHNS